MLIPRKALKTIALPSFDKSFSVCGEDVEFKFWYLNASSLQGALVNGGRKGKYEPVNIIFFYAIKSLSVNQHLHYTSNTVFQILDMNVQELFQF